jgi:predicted nucleic acid-binding protein
MQEIGAFEAKNRLGALLDRVERTETSAAAWDATLLLSDRFGLSVHDAAYLELAQRRRLPLATRDARLGEAAVALGCGTVA